MWLPYGTAEHDCCHCQQDAELSLGALGLGEDGGHQGLRGLRVVSNLSRKESETFSSSWVLRYLAVFTLIPLLVTRPAVQGVQQDVGGGEITGTVAGRTDRAWKREPACPRGEVTRQLRKRESSKESPKESDGLIRVTLKKVRAFLESEKAIKSSPSFCYCFFCFNN